MESSAPNLIRIVQAGRAIIGAIHNLQKGFFLTIDSHQEYLVTALSIANGLLRPQTHGVVLAEHSVNLAVLRQHIFRYLKAAVLAPPAKIRGGDDLDLCLGDF